MLHFIWILLTCRVIGAPLPNVIYILTDDMGNADASFNFKITNPNKSPPILTPNIDILAENGIILSQHYSHPVCGPSRCALITSRLSHNLGNPFPTLLAGNLKPGYQTFIHELSDRGYVNHFIGKWGIDYDNRTYSRTDGKWVPAAREKSDTNVGPFGRGFDTFYGMYSSGHNHFTKRVRGMLDWHKFNETHLLDAPHGLDEEIDKSSTTLITRESVQLINDYKVYKKPFFMHISYSMPHDPLQVEQRFLDKNNFPFCHKSPSFRRRLYCGMIAAIDEGIGNITIALKQNNLFDNTVIIFASDNGGFMNVGGFNYPYRGVKTTSFEGGIRTLAFVYGMYNEQKGKVFNKMFHLVDWGVTLLSFIDSQRNKSFVHTMGKDIDGIDLSETLKNFGGTNDKELIYRKNLVAQSEAWNFNTSTYIEGDYKLILGLVQFSDIFYEPNDSWSVSTETRNWHYALMDMANYFIENTLGSPSFFFLEWAFAFRMERMYSGEFGGFKGGEGNPFGIPILDWTQKNAESKIKLFNLKEDETESNNLAFENKAKVEEMYNNLRAELIKTTEIVDEDLFGYIAGIFNTFSFMVFGFFTAIAAMPFLILVCILRCFVCRKKQTKQKDD